VRKHANSFGDVYSALPNFHTIRDASTEAFTTSKMGDVSLDYPQEIATLQIVSQFSPAMSEIEEDLYEAHIDENGKETIHLDDGDSKTSLDWNQLSEWKSRQIPNVPRYELHHAVDVIKDHPYDKPIDLVTLKNKLESPKLTLGEHTEKIFTAENSVSFDIGGIFMFKKNGVWAYRTNEFANENYEQCLVHLKKQAKMLREIIAELLRQYAERTNSQIPKFTTSYSLEKVHAIWKF